MPFTRFRLRGLVIALLLLGATAAEAAQQQPASAASQPGSVLLDKYELMFQDIAATGSAGMGEVQKNLNELMQLARQSLASRQIDQQFFDRYARILRVTMLSGIPDTAGILQPITTREFSNFIKDATGKIVDSAGGIAMEDFSSALEAEIANLRKLASRGPAAAAASAPPTAPVRVGGDIKPPKQTKNVAPVYPDIARAAKVQGMVLIEATIGKDGRVIQARVMRPVPMLDEAALAAVKQWEFEPTSVGGVPVEVIMVVTVSFNLK